MPKKKYGRSISKVTIKVKPKLRNETTDKFPVGNQRLDNVISVGF